VSPAGKRRSRHTSINTANETPGACRVGPAPGVFINAPGGNHAPPVTDRLPVGQQLDERVDIEGVHQPVAVDITVADDAVRILRAICSRVSQRQNERINVKPLISCRRSSCRRDQWRRFAARDVIQQTPVITAASVTNHSVCLQC
jgi:hypothetical protein